MHYGECTPPPRPLLGWPCERVLDEDELIDETVVVDLAIGKKRARGNHTHVKDEEGHASKQTGEQSLKQDREGRH